MKIAFFDLGEENKPMSELFEKAFRDSNALFFKEKLDEKTAEQVKDVEIVSLFMPSRVDKKIIDLLPHLKYIATRSTGYDHIDCEYAKEKGIVVSNVPGYGSTAVAEFTFGLILSLSRNIALANNNVRNGSNLDQLPFMEGSDLMGKTLGVVGTGKIGRHVVKIAHGFSMNVVAYDPYPDLAFAEENNVAYKSLDELLSVSDIVTLHCPHTKESHHLLNQSTIARMKKGVYIINTARGELIDTEALVWGLEAGIIAGAGLDVLEEERELKGGKNDAVIELNRKLMNMPNVIVTPHIAFDSREAVAAIGRITVENIQAFLAGSPINVV